MMPNMEAANKRMEEEADQFSPNSPKLIIEVTQGSPDRHNGEENDRTDRKITEIEQVR